MTNEEKAYEIARFNREFYGECGASHKYSEEECYDSAMDMAKWKDEQFAKEKQALIDKDCEWLRYNKEHSLIGCEDPCLIGFLTEEFIMEFCKTIEGGKNE